MYIYIYIERERERERKKGGLNTRFVDPCVLSQLQTQGKHAEVHATGDIFYSIN